MNPLDAKPGNLHDSSIECRRFDAWNEHRGGVGDAPTSA